MCRSVDTKRASLHAENVECSGEVARHPAGEVAAAPAVATSHCRCRECVAGVVCSVSADPRYNITLKGPRKV